MSKDTAPALMSLRDLIGQGYDEWFYNLDPSKEIYKDGMTKSEWAKSVRYWTVKGGRGSKKSYTVAYWILINMMAYDKSNTLVIRKVADTLKQSCYSLLKKCAYNLGVAHKWKFSLSPMEMTYLPTGQKIIFRGLDDPQKITSIDVEYGSLCWLWVEEAYQITNKDDFDRLDESIRGKLPNGLFKRIMLTFNPWNKSHWLRTAFFETEEGRPLDDKDIFSHTTNYLMNEWLEEADYKLYDRMKRLNPRQYHVAGLGNWGSPEGLIYDGNWEEFDFDYMAVLRRPGVVAFNGLDFGITDPTALCCMLYDEEHYELYIYDELYVKGYTSAMRYEAIEKMGQKNTNTYFDTAGALDSLELMDLGMNNLIPYNKAGEKNSILNGINSIRGLKIYIHPRCVNFITEIENYMWYVDKDGVTQPKPQPGSMDHCLTGDTKVITDRGNRRISEICAGDSVLTHKGYREVISAGITQKHQRIWVLELSDGTIIRGTWNHQIVTVKGIKYLKDVTSTDKVIKWSGPIPEIIPMQNMSSMTVKSGIDTQNPKNVQKESISSIIISNSTDMFGKNTTVPSQKDFRYTISMGIAETTTYPISNASQQKNTIPDIPGQKNARKDKDSILPDNRTNAENGIVPKKVIDGTSNTQNPCSAKRKQSVSVAGKNSQFRTTDVTDFAHLRAGQKTDVEADAMTRFAFVNNAERNSSQTNTVVQGPVLVSAVRCYATDVFEDVYDLTVNDAHDFYANGVLVLNCMDAMRYGVMGYRQSSGGGYIGGTDEDDWKKDYQYALMTDEEIEQRKKDISADEKDDDDDDNDDDGLSWVYST